MARAPGGAPRYEQLLMPQRTRIRARGTIHKPGHALHGAKVDLLQNAPGGDVIVRIRETHGTYMIGALARVSSEEFRREPA